MKEGVLDALDLVLIFSFISFLFDALEPFPRTRKWFQMKI